MGYRPVPLSGQPHEKVVDIGIQRTLDALADHEADVMLASHDGDFTEHLRRLVGGDRRVGVIGLREFTSLQLDVPGISMFDLEDDVKAFNVPLPRVRIISLSDFDPELFLR